MKSVKKLLVFFFFFLLVMSLCACGSSDIDADFVYEQAKFLGIQLESASVYHGCLSNDDNDPVNVLFLNSTEYDDIAPENRTFSYAGIYMLDMDTGIWYDSSFVDWDKVYNETDSFDFRVREDVLMNYLCRYGEKVDFGYDSIKTSDLSAKDIESINQRLQMDMLTQTAAVYPYTSIDEEPRQLSDEEITALLYRPAGYVKAVISTVTDAIAYLDMRYPELWMGMSIYNGVDVEDWWLRSAQEILYCGYDDDAQYASRSCVVNCITYLLEDDYQIESLIAFWPDPNVLNEDGPQKAINFIKTSDGYIFFDPVLRMRGDAVSRYGSQLPQMTCSSLAEYIETIRQTPELADVIKYIFKNSGGVRMEYKKTYTDGYTIETESPGIELVYYSVPAQEPGQDIKPENIGNYKLSSMLGGVTLTAEEAYALVGEEPEVIQETVKTAGDLLMFMMAARITEGDGCYCTDVDGYIWHWNMDVPTFLKKGRGGCGDCANLANYMLAGDYEEVGFMDQAYYPGSGGSHVYTYILYEGEYYIVDFSWYVFNAYEVTRDYIVPVMNSLTQWPEMIQWVYGDVCLVMTYDTPGMQYPVIFGEMYENEFGGMYYVLPEGVEYTVLYEAEDGYQYYHMPFDTSVYDWNVFWK